MTPPPTTGGEGIMFSGYLAGHLSVVCPLTPTLHDAVSLYLAEGFQRNMP